MNVASFSFSVDEIRWNLSFIGSSFISNQCSSQISFLVFGSLLATMLRKYKNLCLHFTRQDGQDRKKYKEIYLVKTQVPKKWRHCLTTSQNWQGSKEFCYICYLLLWSSNLDLPKAGQLEKRHSFVFGFQVTITLDLQKKAKTDVYSLNLIARICRLDNFKSLHNMKILFGCISYFQQIFFIVWKSLEKSLVFPATIY